MSSKSFAPHQWGLILGGSSGFGLATAHKLAAHGMDLCVVHRDRRGAMRRIEPEFDRIREHGVRLLTFNTDALNAERRGAVLDEFAEVMEPDDGIRVLLHSIAFGNLMLLGPVEPSEGEAADRLADALGVDAEQIREAADRLLDEDVDGVEGIASSPDYPEGRFLDDEDVARTVHAMGTSLLTWTQDLRSRGMFAPDARVLGLTSEGSTVAWKGYAAVSAAKAVLESVSRSIAMEMAHDGIRSNVVQAGVTDTRALRAIPGHPHLKAQARGRNPFQRLTTPADVADVIYLLCLPEASWINGSVIRADGGEMISGSSS